MRSPQQTTSVHRHRALRARLAALVASLALLGGGAGAASSEPEPALRLASDRWPPFTDGPGAMRVAVELVEIALKRAGIEARTEIRDDFAALMQDLRADAIDGSPALWRDEERERFLRFSQPYLENRLVLLGRKGSDVGAASLAALAGKRVAIVESYAYGRAVEEVTGPVLVQGKSDQENVGRLLRGEVEYVLADELLLHALFQRQRQRAEMLLELGNVPIVKRPLHFGVRRNLAGSAEIVQRFDAEIRAMIADGSYNRVLGFTWIRADVDGDGTSELVLGGGKAGTTAPRVAYDVFRAPTAEDEAAAAASRYVVGGRTYGRWEEIPVEYRVPADPFSVTETDSSIGIRLFD